MVGGSHFLLLSSFTTGLLWPLEKIGSLAGDREKK